MGVRNAVTITGSSEASTEATLVRRTFVLPDTYAYREGFINVTFIGTKGKLDLETFASNQAITVILQNIGSNAVTVAFDVLVPTTHRTQSIAAGKTLVLSGIYGYDAGGSTGNSINFTAAAGESVIRYVIVGAPLA